MTGRGFAPAPACPPASCSPRSSAWTGARRAPRRGFPRGRRGQPLPLRARTRRRTRPTCCTPWARPLYTLLLAAVRAVGLPAARLLVGLCAAAAAAWFAALACRALGWRTAGLRGRRRSSPSRSSSSRRAGSGPRSRSPRSSARGSSRSRRPTAVARSRDRGRAAARPARRVRRRARDGLVAFSRRAPRRRAPGGPRRLAPLARSFRAGVAPLVGARVRGVRRPALAPRPLAAGLGRRRVLRPRDRGPGSSARSPQVVPAAPHPAARARVLRAGDAERRGRSCSSIALVIGRARGALGARRVRLGRVSRVTS